MMDWASFVLGILATITVLWEFVWLVSVTGDEL